MGSGPSGTGSTTVSSNGQPSTAGQASTNAGVERRVNSTVAFSQQAPDAARLPGGGYVIVWTTNDASDRPEAGVYAQRFAEDGNPAGGETRIAANPGGIRYSNPRVAALASGGFVVAWLASTTDGTRVRVQAQRVASNGVLAGSLQPIHEGVTDNVRFVLAGVADGGFAMAIAPEPPADSSATEDCGMFVQRYGATGTPVGTAQRATTLTTYRCQPQTMIELEGGALLVAWHGFTRPSPNVGSTFGTYIRRFDLNGVAMGPAVLAGQQQFPRAAALPGGGYVMAWLSPENGSNFVKQQQFNTAGTPVTTEAFVDQSLDLQRPACPSLPTRPCTWPNQRDPSVAALPGGGYVVTWSSGDRNQGAPQIYAQRYDSQAARVGPITRASPSTQGGQAAPVALGLTSGGFVIAWEATDAAFDVNIQARQWGAGGLSQ